MMQVARAVSAALRGAAAPGLAHSSRTLKFTGPKRKRLPLSSTVQAPGARRLSSTKVPLLLRSSFTQKRPPSILSEACTPETLGSVSSTTHLPSSRPARTSVPPLTLKTPAGPCRVACCTLLGAGFGAAPPYVGASGALGGVPAGPARFLPPPRKSTTRSSAITVTANEKIGRAHV